jgi:hypothetical protein
MLRKSPRPKSRNLQPNHTTMATATVPQPKAVKPPRVAGPQGPTLWEKILERRWLWGSIAFHIVLGIIATVWIIKNDSVERKKFMKPGGAADAARQGSEHKISLGRKQSTMSAPEQAKRVTTNSSFAKVALPEMPEMPTATTDVFANRAIGTGGAGNAFGATGTPGGGGGGGGSGINFFGLRMRAKSVVVLVDVSDSMVISPPMPVAVPGQPPPQKTVKDARTYTALEREVARVISQLDPSITFGVICFAGDVQRYSETLVQANPTQINNALKFVRERSPALNIVGERKNAEREAAGFKPTNSGKTVTNFNHAGTRTGAALDYAFAMNPDAICLVSDGVPTDGSINGTNILERVKAKQKELPRPAVINVIAYLADNGQKFMRDLAEQNQGTFKEIKPGMQSFGF